MFEERENPRHSYLISVHSNQLFSTGVCQVIRMLFLPANLKHLQMLDTEESRGVHNHLVLDVQLQISQLWNLLRFSNLTEKLTLLQSSNNPLTDLMTSLLWLPYFNFHWDTIFSQTPSFVLLDLGPSTSFIKLMITCICCLDYWIWFEDHFCDLSKQPEIAEAFWMQLNFNIFHSL